MNARRWQLVLVLGVVALFAFAGCTVRDDEDDDEPDEEPDSGDPYKSARSEPLIPPPRAAAGP